MCASKNREAMLDPLKTYKWAQAQDKLTSLSQRSFRARNTNRQRPRPSICALTFNLVYTFPFLCELNTHKLLSAHLVFPTDVPAESMTSIMALCIAPVSMGTRVVFKGSTRSSWHPNPCSPVCVCVHTCAVRGQMCLIGGLCWLGWSLRDSSTCTVSVSAWSSAGAPDTHLLYENTLKIFILKYN